MNIRPIAPGLLTENEDGPRLIGGRSKSDRRIVFPLPQGPSAELYDPFPLGRKGRLWSWTVQRFRPKSPPYAGADTDETFEPFAVGYIELPGEIIVESRLEVEDFSALAVGQPMELVASPFSRASDGDVVVTYAFRPIAKQSAG